MNGTHGADELGGPPPPVEAGGPPPEALDAVRRRLRRGALLAAAAVGMLAVATSLSIWDILALPAFYLFLPALAFAQTPLLETERLERVQVYAGSIVAILLLGWAGLALGVRLEGPIGLGLTVPPMAELIAWSLGAAAAGLLVVAVLHPVDRRIAGPHHRILAQLLPRTGREKGVFLALSGAAGAGEELAYRGYALVGIQLLGVGPWGAVVLSSVAFGFLHAYQGPVGIARTALIGAVLAVSVVVTGSLLPAMLAHALIDVVAGLVLGPFLMTDEDLVPDPRH